MKQHIQILIAFLLITTAMTAQISLEKFSGINIGNPELKGSFEFDKDSQQFILTGAGYNMWFDRDEFYMVYQKITGNFIFSANLKFVGKGVEAHRKIGLMIRNSTKDNAIYMDGAVHGDGLTSLQYRETKGGQTSGIKSEIKAPDFIQVERNGDRFILRVSQDGQPLKEIGNIKLDMGSTVLTGMFICSHNAGVTEKAVFSNVRIEIPAAENINAYKTPAKSRLEIINIETGNRKIVYETDEHIEAPNWSRNGEYLIYNSKGKLYKFTLDNADVSEINTGFATHNNNDHGISFDGKTIAISNLTEVNGKKISIIYTVPVEGGIPARVTEKGPSYWHGWSPDDKWLTYCAERNGNYDVYKIKRTGGKEIRLTTAEGLDDGPEYSPDGKHIYFNSVRSGNMQIWRMKPDGSEQEQVTTDNFQSWFAHPSPDGKWLIMISYLPDVPAGSHPPNKRVMLRLMPADRDTVKTIAFLYGGQGTINVPSWSPDSKNVAFVTYTY